MIAGPPRPTPARSVSLTIKNSPPPKLVSQFLSGGRGVAMMNEGGGGGVDYIVQLVVL